MRKTGDLFVILPSQSHKVRESLIINVGKKSVTLGDLYLTQGKYPQAEHYLRRALDICEKLLPPEHIQQQAILRSLARLR